eukprot:8966918-Pyramimonas_sp.AAC.1
MPLRVFFAFSRVVRLTGRLHSTVTSPPAQYAGRSVQAIASDLHNWETMAANRAESVHEDEGMGPPPEARRWGVTTSATNKK